MIQLDNHPLLNPDIAASVFEHLGDDSRTVYRGMRVCRLWWSEGHKRLWRGARLDDLYSHVQEVERRLYFSRYVESLTIPSGDSILSNGQMDLQSLDLRRLKSLLMHQTNLINIHPPNIASLIVPSLRSLTFRYDSIYVQGQTDRECIIFLNALMPVCHKLTTLDLDLNCSGALLPLLVRLFTRLSAIEHLEIGDLAEDLHSHMHGQDILRLMLNRPRLVTLGFSHAVDFAEHAVQALLAGMGAYWSLPSLQSLSRPVFFSSRAAALLLHRLPNLKCLEFELEEFHGSWGDTLEQTFDALSQLKQLDALELQIAVGECNLNGTWLVRLAGLKKLECLALLFDTDPKVNLTGAQLAALLSGLPRLISLVLHMGTFEVSCSVDEKSTIDTAFARIKRLDLGGLTITTQHRV